VRQTWCSECPLAGSPVGKERDRAVSLFGSIFPIGAMIGPIFGGLFVSYWSWRGVFFVNVPIGLAVILMTLRYVPRDPDGAAHRSPDPIGMALLGIGLVGGMLGVSYLGERSAHVWSPLFVVALIVAVFALWMFFRHINSAANPFIAPRFIHGPGFGAVNLINALLGGVTSGMVALVPIYAINRYGIDALGSATLLVAQGVASIILSIAAAFVLRRTGHRRPLYFGGVTIGIGMLLLSLSPVAGIPPYAWLASSAFVIGVGYGAINPASRNAGLQLAPEHSATVAALRSMSMQIGPMTTISIATAVIAHSDHRGDTEAWIYVLAALLIFAALSFIARVPEHYGAW